MRKIVKVRNLEIGQGIPKICVPLVSKTDEEIIQDANNLKNFKLDLVEWRVDYYENVENLNKVKNILKVLRSILDDLPILFTFRSKREGGEKEISLEYYKKLNKEIIETKMVDLIDVELLVGDEVVKDISKFAHINNVKTVISNHEFYNTPEKNEIISRLCKMQDLGADLPKIAVMPQNSKDVITLLTATEEMVREYSKTPIITMAMGKLGLVSRLTGEIFGSSLTFGSIKVASAPGQIRVEELQKILNIIH
ncbi:type I 3-dehydroquinate dehydratase [Romboutsia sp. 1001713B170207_170306_H8]|uniref:type I 3-dehydroquinate dehydratase n=1 Tax=Romboutsia sp. 1001713B170207_170306_H8 TaxID=2787112 RepID=UPI000822B800|nr:type I 3-dehydroquinate dehydratase [Romboutsia sp. 1001713B170207_170306_H8]SCH86779.1 3-dehydroquinate dehydratase [uncultured Clostridium sp.]